MYKKFVFSSAITLASLAGFATVAQAEIGANAALVSDYRFRGISQSNEDFAIQAGSAL